MSLTAKMMLLFNSLNALVLVLYGIISVRVQVAKELDGIDGKLALAAQNYVKVVGEDKIDRVFQVGAARQKVSKDIGTLPKEDYIADVAFVGQYASDLGLAYLYSMTIVDGKAKYVMDGAPQREIYEGNLKYPMDDYPDASPMFFAAWEKWAPMVEEHTDSFGSFRSYFLPFATKAGNKVLIGADIKIDDVKLRTRDIVISQISIAAVIFAIGFAMTFIFARVVARYLFAKVVARCLTGHQEPIGVDAHVMLRDLMAGVNETAQSNSAVAANLKELNVKIGNVHVVLELATEILKKINP